MKIRSAVYMYIIVREWIEGNEFDNSERVIVVGNMMQGCVIRFLLRNTMKKVFLCDLREFDKKYRCYHKTKWVVCPGRESKQYIYQNTDIIILPNIY